MWWQNFQWVGRSDRSFKTIEQKLARIHAMGSVKKPEGECAAIRQACAGGEILVCAAALGEFRKE
jgi:hypothetical protein